MPFERHRISTAPRAFRSLAAAHNSLVDLLASMDGQSGVKVTQSDGRVLITVNPATLPAGLKGDPGADGVSPPTTSDLLRGDGSGGFSTAALGAGLAFGVSAELRTSAGTDGAILRNDGAHGFSSVTVSGGLRYTGGTLDFRDAGTGLMWGAGGDFTIATLGGGLTAVGTTIRTTSGTDYAILRNDGAHGFASVTIGSGLSYDGASGTLSANAASAFDVLIANHVVANFNVRADNVVSNYAFSNIATWANVTTGNHFVANMNVRADNVVSNYAFSNIETWANVTTGNHFVANMNVRADNVVSNYAFSNIAAWANVTTGNHFVANMNVRADNVVSNYAVSNVNSYSGNVVANNCFRIGDLWMNLADVSRYMNIREINVCEGGVAKKMLVLGSATYT